MPLGVVDGDCDGVAGWEFDEGVDNVFGAIFAFDCEFGWDVLERVGGCCSMNIKDIISIADEVRWNEIRARHIIVSTHHCLQRESAIIPH